MNNLLIPAAVIALVLFAAAGKANAKPATQPEPEPQPEPGPGPQQPAPPVQQPGPGPLVPNPAAEAQACASAVKDKPQSESGASQGDRPLDIWLTWVAFVRAYKRPPGASPDDAARVLSILTCVRDRLQAETPNISAKPTPGAWYRIKKGDTLFEVTKTAYPGGVSLGGKAPNNMQAAQLVNASPENTRFVRMVEAEKNLFPSGRVTFMPIFGTFAQQRANATNGGEGLGKEYAVIWIPTPPGP